LNFQISPLFLPIIDRYKKNNVYAALCYLYLFLQYDKLAPQVLDLRFVAGYNMYNAFATTFVVASLPPFSLSLASLHYRPSLALPCLALPCLALPCLALPCLALPCIALNCLALPSFALPSPAQPSLSLSCLTLPCLHLNLPCLALPCLDLT
jgi:hypothetical protein